MSEEYEEYEAMRSRMAEKGIVILLPEEVERRACAALVREAGCVCFAIARTPAALPRFTQQTTASGDSYRGHVTEHDPRCPVALAAAIEKRGRS